jgi:hypothetical protein
MSYWKIVAGHTEKDPDSAIRPNQRQFTEQKRATAESMIKF